MIGRAVWRRTEKGAAAAAAAYLREQYPDIQGFSPRNLRRMRDFCNCGKCFGATASETVFSALRG